jgi:hypothetical protein
MTSDEVSKESVRMANPFYFGLNSSLLRRSWKGMEDSLPLAVVVGTVGIAFLVVLVFIHHLTGIPIRQFMADPAWILKFPVYIGFVSHLGIFLWSGTAGICYFCYFQLRRSQTDLAGFALHSALLITLLAIDDMFMLHEFVFPNYLSIPQKFVYLSYFLITAVYLFSYRKLILETEILFLLAAFGCFGVSIVVDTTHSIEIPFDDLLEDGAKFVGIMFWSVYYAKTGAWLLLRKKGTDA